MVAVTCSPEGEAEVEAWREDENLHESAAATDVRAKPERAQAIANDYAVSVFSAVSSAKLIHVASWCMSFSAIAGHRRLDSKCFYTCMVR